jgi:DNA helicase-2/ATP-dependent DNA helicase PcrA
VSDLTESQAKALDVSVRLVQAGPGSGKTRALVERFVTTSRQTRRGLALLSFTNAAVDEVQRRTAASPGVTAAPNFVGTIDSFLHRFIVGPAEVPRLGHLPSFRHTWADLPSHMATLRLSGLAGAGVPLDAFRKTASGAFVVNEGQLDSAQRQYLTDVDADGRRTDLVSRAVSIVNGLNHSGIYDSNTARVKAYEILSSPEGELVVRRIGLRFEEVLLDEAQDCNEAEFRVIERLGLVTRTVLVADPDQAVFEFRGSDPTLFMTYRDGLPPEQRLSLVGNHRSTGSICSVASSLRTTSAEAIASVSGEAGFPILVLKGSPEQQREKFLTALQDCDLGVGDAIVLSHAAARARKVAGVDDPTGTSTARGNRLVGSCYVLRQPGADARARLEAVTAVEEVILSLVDWPQPIGTEGRQGKLAHLGRDGRWLRRSAGELATQLLAVTDRAAFAPRARVILAAILSRLNTEHLALSHLVQQPDSVIWLKSFAPAADGARLRFSTVHSAKGSEEPAVLVTLPSSLVKDASGRDVLDDWSDGSSSERLRVLYVGVTRAQKLACIGVTNTQAARVSAILASAGINHEVR